MLTAHLVLGDRNVLVFGLVPADRAALARGMAAQFNGEDSDLPNLRFLVLNAESEAEFEALVRASAQEVMGTTAPIVSRRVVPPEERS